MLPPGKKCGVSRWMVEQQKDQTIVRRLVRYIGLVTSVTFCHKGKENRPVKH